jgi:hypothetical protein
MLTTMWKWWRTPMVSEAVAMDLARDCVKCEDDNAQLQADLEQALLDRDAAILERDKAIGKFEYVESRSKELEANLADRDNYIRFLEGQLKQDMDDDDGTVAINELTCEYCGEGLFDCLCEDDDQDAGDDE